MGQGIVVLILVVAGRAAEPVLSENHVLLEVVFVVVQAWLAVVTPAEMLAALMVVDVLLVRIASIILVFLTAARILLVIINVRVVLYISVMALIGIM